MAYLYDIDSIERELAVVNIVSISIIIISVIIIQML